MRCLTYINNKFVLNNKWRLLRRSTNYVILSPPKFENPYIADSFLRLLLNNYLPREVFNPISKDLAKFGMRIVSEIDLLGQQAELEQPLLTEYSQNGEKIDDVVTSIAWKKLKYISAEEGLVSIPFEQLYGKYNRVYQAAKLFLFAPSSGLYSCPLAMTDGAARLIEAENVTQLKERAFKFLTSRIPSEFWTSGQWMTERNGGSDVSGATETEAVKESDGFYKLYGRKFFTSAVDSEMSFTLARHHDNPHDGLSLFYLETKLENGNYNSIEIERLKNKLGTRQLPTAELILNGTRAQLIGPSHRGIKLISHMLTITRLHNSASAVGAMRRTVQLAAEYSKKRTTFGKFLFEHPLHVHTLAGMESTTMQCTAFAMDAFRILGLIENGEATHNDHILLRLLTPLLKLYTAKYAVSVTSEGLECFGGQGYIEDTGLPRLLRDAQVLPIWEGTTNILCLDLLRVLEKSNGEAFKVFIDLVIYRILLVTKKCRELKLAANTLKADVETFQTQYDNLLSVDSLTIQTAARDLAFTICKIYIASLFLEYAAVENPHRIVILMAEHLCLRKNLRLKGLIEYGDCSRNSELQMLYLNDNDLQI